MKYSQTHIKTQEACHVFFILPFYDNEFIIYLFMSFIHLSRLLETHASYTYNGVIFMFHSSEEVARGWNLIILST